MAEEIWFIPVASVESPGGGTVPPDREGHAGPEADIGWEGLLKLRSGCPPHAKRAIPLQRHANAEDPHVASESHPR